MDLFSKINSGVKTVRKPILLFCLLLSACAINTQVYKPLDVTSYKSGALKIAIDYWNLQDTISYRIENLGIDVIDLSITKEPDILITVEYQTKCESFFRTECFITFFDIDFRDSKTGELILASRYKDLVGFINSGNDSNYVDHILNLLFDDIKKKLNIL